MLNFNISTILLQMANFLIMAFILYRFLFNPLQNILKKREAEITREIDEAQDAQNKAEETRRLYEEKVDNIDAEIAARKNEARIVIEQTRRQMLQEVQSDIEDLEKQAKETLSRLQAESIQQHKKQIGNLALKFTKDLLTELFTSEIQQTYQEKFLKYISDIDLATYLQNTSNDDIISVDIILASQPDKMFQGRLVSKLHKDLSKEFNPIFTIDPEIIAGGIIKFGNEIFDGSLRGQIDHLIKEYQERE